MTIGSPGISVLGPNWNLGGILEGSHSVLLQAGRDPINFPGLNVSAAIAQSGQIPINSQSLLVRIQGNNFGINFAGQILATYEMSVAANYKVYGVDVSMFAGQTGELRFTSVSTSSQPFNNLYLDAISFSQQSVPEPNSAALIALGTLLFGVRSRLMRSWCA